MPVDIEPGLGPARGRYQASMAAALKIDPSHLSRIRSGAANAGEMLSWKMAKFFNTAPELWRSGGSRIARASAFEGKRRELFDGGGPGAAPERG